MVCVHMFIIIMKIHLHVGLGTTVQKYFHVSFRHNCWVDLSICGWDLCFWNEGKKANPLTIRFTWITNEKKVACERGAAVWILWLFCWKYQLTLIIKLYVDMLYICKFYTLYTYVYIYMLIRGWDLTRRETPGSVAVHHKM